jgi:hypothetical protein
MSVTFKLTMSTLKKAINEKYQLNIKLICKLKNALNKM